MRKDVFQTFNLGQLSESKSTFPMRQWGVTASLVQADYRYPWIRHWAKNCERGILHQDAASVTSLVTKAVLVTAGECMRCRG